MCADEARQLTISPVHLSLALARHSREQHVTPSASDAVRFDDLAAHPPAHA